MGIFPLLTYDIMNPGSVRIPVSPTAAAHDRAHHVINGNCEGTEQLHRI